MNTSDEKKVTKEYDYDDIIISLENCIIPSEKIDETPSMKDGLDRDTENDIRIYGCELIQIAGLLLRLPQVAMATGQVLLQRFYYSKSLVKHEVEVSAMAAVFLAAKIEECPRRIRDIINVYEHVKQRFLKKPHTPMDYLGNHYYNLKNAIIKAERRILKELGFCVHVKHPHKIIITYLQILGLETNVALARKAWNFMNDSLRTDVFVRFSPEIVACSCIFLAARNCKVSLPLRPPWWELFDATFDDIEDIALSILRLYARPRRKITHLEAIVNKLKKAQQQDSTKTSTDTPNAPHGSFTPSHVPSTAQPPVAINNNNTSKPSSKTNSPVDKIPEKRLVSSVIAAPRRPASDDRKADKDERHRRGKSESDESSEYSSASEAELPTKKYAKQRKQFENKKRRSPSTESDNERRTVPSKIRRSVSPVENHRKLKSRESRNRVRDGKDNNGQYTKYDTYSKSKRRSRSRSPVKRNKSISPTYRKEKYMKEKVRSKNRSSDKYDKHPKYRR